MPNRFWTAPLFWVGLYAVGVVSAVVVHFVPTLQKRLLQVSARLRVLLLIPFLVPPFALALVHQPRLGCSPVIGWLVGVPLLVLAVVGGLLSLREIGLRPAWGKPKGLVTRGIYRVVRHPIYLSVILSVAGWAIGFRAVYALLFVPVLTASYVALIFMEEHRLRAEYGDAYQKYVERVPWRLIPGVF